MFNYVKHKYFSASKEKEISVVDVKEKTKSEHIQALERENAQLRAMLNKEIHTTYHLCIRYLHMKYMKDQLNVKYEQLQKEYNDSLCHAMINLNEILNKINTSDDHFIDQNKYIPLNILNKSLSLSLQDRNCKLSISNDHDYVLEMLNSSEQIKCNNKNKMFDLEALGIDTNKEMFHNEQEKTNKNHSECKLHKCKVHKCKIRKCKVHKCRKHKCILKQKEGKNIAHDKICINSISKVLINNDNQNSGSAETKTSICNQHEPNNYFIATNKMENVTKDIERNKKFRSIKHSNFLKSNQLEPLKEALKSSEKQQVLDETNTNYMNCSRCEQTSGNMDIKLKKYSDNDLKQIISPERISKTSNICKHHMREFIIEDNKDFISCGTGIDNIQHTFLKSHTKLHQQPFQDSKTHDVKNVNNNYDSHNNQLRQVMKDEGSHNKLSREFKDYSKHLSETSSNFRTNNIKLLVNKFEDYENQLRGKDTSQYIQNDFENTKYETPIPLSESKSTIKTNSSNDVEVTHIQSAPNIVQNFEFVHYTKIKRSVSKISVRDMCTNT
ncbi:hypothetical protein L9F63_007555 [Diploptera punctata]|uniref:Uncharacterized protein n=1 Tax=Diploptera punctata TaxID=6984 RepID=A0AAD8E3K3_DIPPU|nr:hypothetical protein L9F63_007555 [Diploptera punctata]